MRKNQPLPWEPGSYTRTTIKTKSGSTYRISQDMFDKYPTLQKEGASSAKKLYEVTPIHVGDKTTFTFFNGKTEDLTKVKSITTSPVTEITNEVGIKKDIISTKNSVYIYTPNYDKSQPDIVGYIHNAKFPTPDNTVPISSMSEIEPDKPFTFTIHPSAPEGLAGRKIKTSDVNEHMFRVDYEKWNEPQKREIPDVASDFGSYENVGWNHTLDDYQ